MGIENIPVILCSVLMAVIVQESESQDQSSGYRLDQGA